MGRRGSQTRETSLHGQQGFVLFAESVQHPYPQPKPMQQASNPYDWIISSNTSQRPCKGFGIKSDNMCERAQRPGGNHTNQEISGKQLKLECNQLVAAR